MCSLDIQSFARLHFGLLQMSEHFPYCNIGIGAALTEPFWHLQAYPTMEPESLIVPPKGRDLGPGALVAAQSLIARLDGSREVDLRIRFEILDHITPHIGLGSKTALLRGIWHGFSKLTQQSLPRATMKRGGTSGIGVNLIEKGGVIVDAGHSASSEEPLAPSRERGGLAIPKVISRFNPVDAKLLLAAVEGERGPSGNIEATIFKRHLPISENESQEIAAEVLFSALPALAGHDWLEFGKALQRLQYKGFKRIEWRIQSRQTRDLASIGLECGAVCAALSSMGPTIAFFAENIPHLRSRLLEATDDKFEVWTVESTVNNRGLESSLINA